MTSHFYDHKKCLAADGSVLLKLWQRKITADIAKCRLGGGAKLSLVENHCSFDSLFKSSGFWYRFGGTCWCWVSPNEWHGTVNSVNIGHARVSDRSLETEALNLNRKEWYLGETYVCHPWGEITQPLEALEVLFLNRKVLFWLMH